MVLMQAIMFVVPSVTAAILMSFPCLALVIKLLLEPVMGIGFAPVPTP